MKKMNNKGFAISTLLYSLSIMGFLLVSVMVSIMSLNRINTKSLVKQVEDELNRYSLTETTFKAEESNKVVAQEFIVPQGESGFYKIELWGAQGGDKLGQKGGKGAYTSGTVYLKSNEKLYFYIGKKGTSTVGGANGGANGKKDDSQSLDVAGGGGATDVRLIEDSDLADDISGELTRIMVAAGGGGGGKSKISGTEKIRAGGDGGTIIGLRYSDEPQIKGSATQKPDNSTSFFARSAKSGAGGGYNAGGIQEGGSSYIAGYAGVNSYTRADDRNAAALPKQKEETKFPFYAKEQLDSTTYDFIRDYNFFNAFMLPGVQTGDGYATIRKVSSEAETSIPPVKTNYIDNIASIQDCVTSITSKNKDNPSTKDAESTAIQWPEIQLINKSGVNVLKGAPVTISTGTAVASHPANHATDGKIETYAETASAAGSKCITITVPTENRGPNIELAVYHKPGELKNHILKVNYASGGSYEVINGNHEAHITGEHISAYSPKYGDNNVANGNYYIISSHQKNMAIRTFAQSSSFGVGGDINDATELKAAKISGTNYQKWYFEKLADGSAYKIIEGQDSKALQISTGVYVNDQKLSAPYMYVGNAEEKWNFKANKLGRFQIYSTKAGVNAYIRHNTVEDTIITDAPNIRNDEANKKESYKTEFYLINAEY